MTESAQPDIPDASLLLNILETGLLIVDRNNRVLMWNGWMEKITGLRQQDVLRKSLDELLERPPAPALKHAIQMACEQGLSRRLSYQLNPQLLPLVKRNLSAPLYHSILVSPITYQQQTACLLQINDVSNAVKREKHLRQTEALLRFEKQILSLVAVNVNLEEILKQACDAIQQLIPGCTPYLQLYDATTGCLRSQYQIANANVKLPLHFNPLFDNSPAAKAATTKQPVIINNYTHHDQVGAWWCHPLLTSENKLAGVLQLVWPKQEPEPELAPSFLERIAQPIRLALQNHRHLMQVHYLAEHDPLTGLCNRTKLNRILAQACEDAAQKHSCFALFFIDLDGFKAINDTYGHEAGDALLIELTQRLQQAISPGDTASRLGGDEMVVLAPSLTTHEQAQAFGQKLIETFSRPHPWQNHVLHGGASIGIALYPHQGSTPRELLTAADDAMYQAKARGKRQAVSSTMTIS